MYGIRCGDLRTSVCHSCMPFLNKCIPSITNERRNDKKTTQKKNTEKKLIRARIFAFSVILILSTVYTIIIDLRRNILSRMCAEFRCEQKETFKTYRQQKVQ